MKALHFGAGNIGRGFIGILLKKSGYDVCFVDVNDELISRLKTDKEYTIYYLDETNSSDKVEQVEALHGSKDEEQLFAQLTTCDLITTSLGQANLKYISSNIVTAIKLRIASGVTSKIDIIACENGLRVSSYFKQLICQELTQDELEYVDKYIGFVDCTVDRIVPDQQNDNICDVKVEPTFEWVLCQSQVKANNEIIDANYTDNLDYYNKRKLLTVNLTHSLIGYIGYNLGKKYVHETIAIAEVESFVNKVLNDITNALVIEFDVDRDVQTKYAYKTIERFKNKQIVDELTRVARNPLSKLGNDERYISPLKVLLANDLECESLCYAISYALAYDAAIDEQAVKMSALINEIGIKEAIGEITQLTNERIIDVIANKYKQITN